MRKQSPMSNIKIEKKNCSRMQLHNELEMSSTEFWQSKTNVNRTTQSNLTTKMEFHHIRYKFACIQVNLILDLYLC